MSRRRAKLGQCSAKYTQEEGNSSVYDRFECQRLTIARLRAQLAAADRVIEAANALAEAVRLDKDTLGLLMPYDTARRAREEMPG